MSAQIRLYFNNAYCLWEPRHTSTCSNMISQSHSRNPRSILDCTAGDVRYPSLVYYIVSDQTCSLLTAGAEPEGEECRGQVP